VIPSCGTFDYVTIVPDPPNTDSCAWEVRIRDPIEPKGDDLSDSRLVGLTPRLQIVDAGLSPDREINGSKWPVPPKVLDHVFGDRCLGHLNSELEQFRVQAGCSPAHVCRIHVSDQVSGFLRHAGPS